METSAKPAATEIAVFDVCDTLYTSNTTFDFVKFVLRKEKKTGLYVLYKLLNEKWSPAFVGLHFLQKIQKVDLAKKLSLGLLRGMLRKDLESYANQFVERYLNRRKIEVTTNMIQEMKNKGVQVLFFSGSLDVVVAAIARQWSVDYRASEMEFDAAGRFTGALKKDLTGNKLKELANFVTSGKTRLTIITDNLSDMDMARAAHKCYIIVKNEKARDLWKGLNPEFICLPKS